MISSQQNHSKIKYINNNVGKDFICMFVCYDCIGFFVVVAFLWCVCLRVIEGCMCWGLFVIGFGIMEFEV